MSIIIVAGTYDGVLAGWELQANKLKIAFASPVHDGSVRSLSIANRNAAAPLLVSCGYDELLKTHDFSNRLTSSGEVRTPSDFGTPVCSSFAPPAAACGDAATTISSHCVIGFSGGKLVIYKRNDWVVQHVLAGHEGGVNALAVHPSGKLALTGGSDGKLKLWDLTKGRLAYVSKLQPAASSVQGQTHFEMVQSIVWNKNGSAYGYCHGSHVTVKDAASAKDLLDVELPSRVNQFCFLQVHEGLLVVAACNDGSLPVLMVGTVDDKDQERRAIMAIEPVQGPVAGEERFKCVQSVRDYLVATANSAGVVSLMDLKGAVNMLIKDDAGGESPVSPESDQEEEEEDEEEELAVEVIDSVQLGTGARITCLAAWSQPTVEEIKAAEKEVAVVDTEDDKKRKRLGTTTTTSPTILDSDKLVKARELVSTAKNIQKRKDRKRLKKSSF
jgi:WD40 repeat protein